MDFIAVGIGGFLGAMARFVLGKTLNLGIFGYFPFGTLFVNLSGCLILSFFLTLTIKHLSIAPNLRLAISTGFLGAYTTFSTFTVESLNLIRSNHLPEALVYILGSSFGSLVFAWLGVSLSRPISEKKPKEAENIRPDLEKDQCQAQPDSKES